MSYSVFFPLKLVHAWSATWYLERAEHFGGIFEYYPADRSGIVEAELPIQAAGVLKFGVVATAS